MVKSLVVLAVALILGMVYMLGKGDDPEETKIFASSAPVAPAQLELRLSVPSSEAEQKASTFEGMRRKFLSTTNYAAFIHEAMQKPREGGRFYAYLAFQKCIESESVSLDTNPAVTGDSTARAQALTRVEDTKARCKDVKTMFPSERNFILTLRNLNSREADALLTENGTIRGNDRKSYQADIDKARATGDPILLAATLDSNIDYLADSIDPSYRDGANRPVLYIAMAAASCELTGDCTTSSQLDTVCVVGGQCQHKDLREYLKSQVAQESHAVYESTRKAILNIARRKG